MAFQQEKERWGGARACADRASSSRPARLYSRQKWESEPKLWTGRDRKCSFRSTAPEAPSPGLLQCEGHVLKTARHTSKCPLSSQGGEVKGINDGGLIKSLRTASTGERALSTEYFPCKQEHLRLLPLGKHAARWHAHRVCL